MARKCKGCSKKEVDKIIKMCIKSRPVAGRTIAGGPIAGGPIAGGRAPSAYNLYVKEHIKEMEGPTPRLRMKQVAALWKLSKA